MPIEIHQTTERFLDMWFTSKKRFEYLDCNKIKTLYFEEVLKIVDQVKIDLWGDYWERQWGFVGRHRFSFIQNHLVTIKGIKWTKHYTGFKFPLSFVNKTLDLGHLPPL